jgi:hypothetical protein
MHRNRRQQKDRKAVCRFGDGDGAERQVRNRHGVQFEVLADARVAIVRNQELYVSHLREPRRRNIDPLAAARSGQEIEHVEIRRM